MDLQQLIKEAKQGSSAAEKCLFDELCGRMLALCGRYVKNMHDAEEVMLDGFYKFFNGLDGFSYQHDAALHAWVKKIMVNECLMFLRKKNNFNLVPETDAEELPLQEDALNNMSAAEIFSMIVQLPVGYRTVFNLHVMEGMEHKEIAALLGITEGTSKSQLSRAKTLLQKILFQKGVNYGKQQSR